ncbi:MAG: histidine kinase [Thermoanaerobaculia bacterium]|nr:histidine kinase [Thermoanaerobaculia bacterium]
MKNPGSVFWWVLPLCLMWSAGIRAQLLLSLDSLSASWESFPEKYLEYVEQPRDSFWDLEAVQSLPDSVWRPLDTYYGAFFGLSTAGYWMRFKIRHDRELPLSILLECNNPNLDTLAIYSDGPGSPEVSQISGMLVPPDSRELNYSNLIFIWPLPADEINTVYLYARSLYYPANFSLSVGDEEHWKLKIKLVEVAASILFFAFVLVYLFTLTVLFSIVGERHLWLFYSYVLLTAIFIANDLGIWYWVWPEWDYRVLTPTVLNLSLVSGLLFVRYHFKTESRYRYFDWGLILLTAMALATAGLSLLLRNRPEVFMGLSKVLIINVLITCAAITSLVFYSYYRQRDREKIWFIIAFTPHGLAIVLTCLQQLGYSHAALSALLYASPFGVQLNTPWLLLAGILWEMIIVSMLFVLRIRDFYESSNRMLAERRDALVLGVETERKRVAQELHDGIGVLLSSTKMKLAALRDRMKGQAEIYQETGDLMNNIDQAHEEMRELAYNLMPKSLEKLGLAQAIEGMVSRLRRNHPDVQWHFYSNFQNGHLDELTKINLFRIAQEMLHNVMQHAQATEAHLQLLRQGKQIVLSMEDNGRGFQPQAPNARIGIGLSNIRYRAEDVLKGRVSIESTPGKGTFIAVVVGV